MMQFSILNLNFIGVVFMFLDLFIGVFIEVME